MKLCTDPSGKRLLPVGQTFPCTSTVIRIVLKSLKLLQYLKLVYFIFLLLYLKMKKKYVETLCHKVLPIWYLFSRLFLSFRYRVQLLGVQTRQRAIDLFKEVWIGAIFFWKVVNISSKGILFACNGCNQLDSSRFRKIRFKFMQK